MIDSRSVIASANPAAILPGEALQGTLPIPLDVSTGSSAGAATESRDGFMHALWHDIETLGRDAFADLPDDAPFLARWRAASRVEDKELLGIAWHLHIHIGTLLDCGAVTAAQRRAIRQAMAKLGASAAEPRQSV